MCERERVFTPPWLIISSHHCLKHIKKWQCFGFFFSFILRKSTELKASAGVGKMCTTHSHTALNVVYTFPIHCIIWQYYLKNQCCEMMLRFRFVLDFCYEWLNKIICGLKKTCCKCWTPLSRLIIISGGDSDTVRHLSDFWHHKTLQCGWNKTINVRTSPTHEPTHTYT